MIWCLPSLLLLSRYSCRLDVFFLFIHFGTFYHVLFAHSGCACRENAAATSNFVRVNNYSTRYVDAITVIIQRKRENEEKKKRQFIVQFKASDKYLWIEQTVGHEKTTTLSRFISFNHF